jgi:hypothetical protein
MVTAKDESRPMGTNIKLMKTTNPPNDSFEHNGKSI